MTVAREGAVAPNFDLASTEEAMLMLVDETVRTALVVYFFADPGSERTKADLQALAAMIPKLGALRARPWAVAPAKLDELRRLQRELALPFPLLHDDRGLARQYGFEKPAADAPAADVAPVLAVVGRATLGPKGEPLPARVLRIWNPAPAVASLAGEITAALGALPRATASMPGEVLDRFTDWRVNR